MKLFLFAVLAIWMVTIPFYAFAQDRHSGPQREHSHDRARPGPWDNDLLVYSIDGTGAQKELAVIQGAGVSTVARMKDGRLIAAFQHFPQEDSANFDRIAVQFSGDEGRTWSRPEPIAVDGMDAGLVRPFDPTLVVLPDGRIRLYFTSNRTLDIRRGAPAIYSGISNDGITYKFEPGVRFSLEGFIVIDCAVALHDGIFHLIVPDNGRADEFADDRQHRRPGMGKGYHAVSRDGLKFDRVDDVVLPVPGSWLGNMLSDQGYLLFFGTGGGPWPVRSVDGSSWEADASSASSARLRGAYVDPGAVKLLNGGWLVIVTGPPRPGTPGAMKRLSDGARHPDAGQR